MGSLNKYIIVLVTVLTIVLVFLIKNNIDLRKDRNRISSNYETVLLNLNKEQQLTRVEVKKMYFKYDSLAKTLDIKLKNVENIINIEYRYKDTTITHAQTFFDTVHNKLTFMATQKCYTIFGSVKEKKVDIDTIENNDNLDLFIYEEKPQLLKISNFINWKKFWKKYTNTAKVYSECKGGLMLIKENIKIIKK